MKAVRLNKMDGFHSIREKQMAEPKKILRMWQFWVVIIASTLGLGSQLRHPIYKVMDIQPASASQAADSTIKDLIDAERRARIEVDNDTRQMVGCILFNIPPERCRDFIIPVSFK